MTKNIVHIILASLVLFSTMGVTVERHYCQQELKDVAVFVAPKNCHDISEKVASKGCCSRQKSNQALCQKTAKNGNCCHNEGDFLKSDEDFISSTFQSYTPPLFDLLCIIYTIYQDFNLPSFSINKPTFLYPPPKLPNILLLVQAFLC